MPILYPDAAAPCAVFSGACAPEEADGLLEWLRNTPAPSADLSGCAGLHTALLQLLLAGRVAIAAPPGDPRLAECLALALPDAPAARPDATPKSQPNPTQSNPAQPGPAHPRPARKRRAPAATQL